MEFKDTLAEFKKDIDREIETYFDRVIEEASKRDFFIADSLKYVKKSILAGGKRIRPALMYWGYIGAGGKEKEKIMKAAVSIELIHTFLLIHDDIIDRDDKRHGMDSVSFKYSKIGKRIFHQNDYAHFGDSMAIIIGDMVGAMGNQIIFESQFSPELIMRALFKLQSIVSMTVIGQSKDICMEYRKYATEKEILEMYEYKTAKYTLEGPLQLGMILGGAKEEDLSSITDFSVPIGIAFQIQDDILGVFGSEDKIGKAIGSDIKEGKQTLLLIKAKERANKEQRKILEELFSKKNVSLSDVKQFQKIIVETGSLDYTQGIGQKLIEDGKETLLHMRLNTEAKKFLFQMADYMIERKI